MEIPKWRDRLNRHVCGSKMPQDGSMPDEFCTLPRRHMAQARQHVSPDFTVADLLAKFSRA